MEGTNQIKLTKHDAPDGKHHFIPLSWVDHVDQQVHLNKAGERRQGAVEGRVVSPY